MPSSPLPPAAGYPTPPLEQGTEFNPMAEISFFKPLVKAYHGKVSKKYRLAEGEL